MKLSKIKILHEQRTWPSASMLETEGFVNDKNVSVVRCTSQNAGESPRGIVLPRDHEASPFLLFALLQALLVAAVHCAPQGLVSLNFAHMCVSGVRRETSVPKGEGASVVSCCVSN